MKTIITFTAIIITAGLAAACGQIQPLENQPASFGPDFQFESLSDAVAVDAKELFKTTVHVNMQKKCMGCHMGMGEPFNLANDAEQDYTAAKAKIVVGQPDASIIYQKVSGATRHGGGARWKPGSKELADLANWISAEVQ